jgi:hypothetical protein
MALGMPRYYTGKPCKQGHITERLTGSGRCHDCHKIAKKKWLNTPTGKQAKKDWDRRNIHKRRARMRNRSSAQPPWTNTQAISEFYRECPAGFHVDHIVPLNNSVVCGLHIVENMQYLPEKENLKKGNKLDESTAVGYFCRLGVEKQP